MYVHTLQSRIQFHSMGSIKILFLLMPAIVGTELPWIPDILLRRIILFIEDVARVDDSVRTNFLRHLMLPIDPYVQPPGKGFSGVEL